jgi:hypothetical protein
MSRAHVLGPQLQLKICVSLAEARFDDALQIASHAAIDVSEGC